MRYKKTMLMVIDKKNGKNKSNEETIDLKKWINNNLKKKKKKKNKLNYIIKKNNYKKFKKMS